VEEYGFVENSGGAGEFRGGMGLRRVLTPVDHECVFNGAGERFRYQPWGLFGGMPGASGQFLLEDDQGVRRLDDKPNEVEIKLGTKVTVETPGAGGYGPPADRGLDARHRDIQSGKYSSEFMDRHYSGNEMERQ
jgi:N-methylhydantoinase B